MIPFLQHPRRRMCGSVGNVLVIIVEREALFSPSRGATGRRRSDARIEARENEIMSEMTSLASDFISTYKSFLPASPEEMKEEKEKL